MKRDLRKSTTAKSKELNERLKEREVKSRQRQSRHLLKVAESNKASIDEALELLSVVESEKSSDSGSEVAG